MASVTAAEVREIFDTGLSDSGLQTYISMGENAAEKAVSGIDVDTADEDTLAKLLSAHYATASDPTAQSSATGDADDSYERPAENVGGIRETRYGRRAVEYASTLGVNLVAEIEQPDAAFFQSIGIHRD